jgi:GT2 family glycosyltransferase
LPGRSVAVIVLNWNGKRFLRPCLESVLLDACSHVEVVVADNGSSDGSVELVKETFPEVRLIEFGANLGFGPGYNAAIAQVKADFIVLLNNDTVVEPGWLGPLIDELIADRRVAITTSCVVFFGTRVLNAAGGKLKLWTGGGELGFGEDVEFLSDRNDVEPFYGSGSAMAISRELFLRLGGFDRALTMYAEDLDLSWRARLAGFVVRYIPTSTVLHRYSGSSAVFNPTKNRLGTTHFMTVMIRCLSFHNLVHSFPAYAMFSILKGTAIALAERDLIYITNVFAALGEVAHRFPSLLAERREIQKLRVAADRRILKSEGFGLMESPRGLLRIFRQGRRLSQRASTDHS